MAQKAYSLAHTKWMCKYHIVFTPKYRRKIIYNQIRADIGEILKKLCEYKGIEIIEGRLMPDHVHMLVAIPPKYSVASVMGYQKGKSSLMIFDKACQPEVQIWQQEVLGAGILRVDRRAQRGDDREIHSGAGIPGHRRGQAEREGVRGPVRQEVTAGRFLPAIRVKALLGLNEVKAGALRRWPASKGYTLRANHPLCGWS